SAVEAHAQGLDFARSEFQRESAIGTDGDGSRLALEQVHLVERLSGCARTQLGGGRAAVGLIQAQDQRLLVLGPPGGLEENTWVGYVGQRKPRRQAAGVGRLVAPDERPAEGVCSPPNLRQAGGVR